MTQAVTEQRPPSMEARCAHYGSEIVRRKGEVSDPKRLKTLARNALGILREQGIYGFFSFLKYRAKDGGTLIWEQVRALWQDTAMGPLMSRGGEERAQVIALTEDLGVLLLAREVASRALIYALYGLRAEGKE
jgi:hypothetical protein